MSLKNAFLKALSTAARPYILRHQNQQKRILIVATTALGDTLWATPGIESLRKSFRNCYLAVLTSPIGLQILKHNPYIDRLYRLEEPVLPRFGNLRKQLYADRFDTILLFHASQRLVLPLCSSIGASQIVGTKGINKGLDSFLTDPLPNLRQHEIVRRLRMIEQIGGSIHTETLSFFLREEERLPKRKEYWVALHPGSKDGFKRWPEKNFAEVGRNLKERLGCKILITGTKDEEELMHRTAAMIPGSQIAERDLSVRSFAALLEQMDLLVCNDTGPFHLACAMNKPAIGIYSATDPFLCGPHKASSGFAIAKKPSCTPCLKRKCREPFCLLQIGSCEVIDACLKIMS